MVLDTFSELRHQACKARHLRSSLRIQFKLTRPHHLFDDDESMLQNFQ
jgi:hypothetical protein